MTQLGWRFVVASAVGAAAVALALAVPTAIIDNPLFSRMTPVAPEQYVFWVLTSLLTGALLASYFTPAAQSQVAAPSAGAGLLGVLAVGCPICNKVVVALIGTSGALNYFAPLQPLLGLLAVCMASWALALRLRQANECAVDRAHRTRA